MGKIKEGLHYTSTRVIDAASDARVQLLAMQTAAAGIGIEITTQLGYSTNTLLATIPILIYTSKKLYERSKTSETTHRIASSAVASGTFGSLLYYSAAEQRTLVPFAVASGIAAAREGIHLYKETRNSKQNIPVAPIVVFEENKEAMSKSIHPSTRNEEITQAGVI